MGNQKVYCKKCRSTNTYSTEQYKEGVGGFGYRKMLKKYKCRDCGYEFWR
jgi:hypothetical protein